MQTDEICFEQFLATGSLPSFKVIYDRHFDAIRQFVARKYLAGDDAKAAKVTEFAFRQLLDHPGLYEKRYKLRPWLFSTAAKRAIRFRQAGSTVAICQRHGVLPCDHRGMVKLARIIHDCLGEGVVIGQEVGWGFGFAMRAECPLTPSGAGGEEVGLRGG